MALPGRNDPQFTAHMNFSKPASRSLQPLPEERELAGISNGENLTRETFRDLRGKRHYLPLES
jgi:hypothetical protein